MRFGFERYTDLGELGEHLLYIEGHILDELERQVSAVMLSICIVRATGNIEICHILTARVRSKFEVELIERYLDSKQS